MPEISVIISTHNRRKELRRAIRSVLNQSYKDLEVLVVDDCSDYSVKEFLKEFKDERIRFFRTEQNSGHDGLPKNIGIKNAQGKFISFLDDDDVYRKDAMRILHAYILETRQEVVYGDYVFLNAKGAKSPGWSVEFSLPRLLKHNYISMTTLMVKADDIKAIGGFDEAVPKYKDWNLAIRLFKNGCGFFHVPIIVTEVHALEESVSTRFLTENDENGLPKPTYFDPVDCLIWPERTFLGTHIPLKVAVYTLTNGRLKYLHEMAEKMERLAGYDYDWFVYDDGSADGTEEWLKGLNKATGAKHRKQLYVRRGEHKGLGHAWNQAVAFVKETGKYDIIIKIDDDAMMLSEGWLLAMTEIYRRNMRVCLSPSIEGLEGTPGGVLRLGRNGDSPYLMLNDTIMGMVSHLGGIIYATPIVLWDSFRFDEESKGNKDVLLSNHAREEGCSLWYLEEYKASHGPDGSSAQKLDYPNRA